jgi:hypothetical protein
MLIEEHIIKKACIYRLKHCFMKINSNYIEINRNNKKLNLDPMIELILISGLTEWIFLKSL